MQPTTAKFPARSDQQLEGKIRAKLIYLPYLSKALDIINIGATVPDIHT